MSKWIYFASRQRRPENSSIYRAAEVIRCTSVDDALYMIYRARSRRTWWWQIWYAAVTAGVPWIHLLAFEDNSSSPATHPQTSRESTSSGPTACTSAIKKTVSNVVWQQQIIHFVSGERLCWQPLSSDTVLLCWGEWGAKNAGVVIGPAFSVTSLCYSKFNDFSVASTSEFNVNACRWQNTMFKEDQIIQNRHVCVVRWNCSVNAIDCVRWI